MCVRMTCSIKRLLIFIFFLHAHIRHENEILHDDQSRCEEILRSGQRPLPLAIFLLTRMLTRDVFAVAHLLVANSAGA